MPRLEWTHLTNAEFFIQIIRFLKTLSEGGVNHNRETLLFQKNMAPRRCFYLNAVFPRARVALVERKTSHVQSIRSNNEMLQKSFSGIETELESIAGHIVLQLSKTRKKRKSISCENQSMYSVSVLHDKGGGFPLSKAGSCLNHSMMLGAITLSSAIQKLNNAI